VTFTKFDAWVSSIQEAYFPTGKLLFLFYFILKEKHIGKFSQTYD
jgi:hypothetical protein